MIDLQIFISSSICIKNQLFQKLLIMIFLVEIVNKPKKKYINKEFFSNFFNFSISKPKVFA